jgi:hypothetical protein
MKRPFDRSDSPLAYLITFTTYGTWLPGDERGWVDRRQNWFGTPYPQARPALTRKAESALSEPAFALDGSRRAVVLTAIEEVCIHRGWRLEAAHVRSRHIHTVVSACALPEAVLNAFKAWSSRKLKSAGFDCARKKRWTRHGGMDYLWTEESVEAAIDYVLNRQGAPLSVYPKPPSEPRA